MIMMVKLKYFIEVLDSVEMLLRCTLSAFVSLMFQNYYFDTNRLYLKIISFIWKTHACDAVSWSQCLLSPLWEFVNFSSPSD